jgi:hypothetical protein
MRRGVAAFEFRRRERPSLDKEIVNCARALGERLAQHRRAAFFGRPLASQV